jgi:TonB family protein
MLNSQKMWDFRVAHRVVFLGIALLFLVPGSGFAQDQASAALPDAGYRADLHTLAGRVLKTADKAKCHPGRCAILVANFTGPSGSTSRLGIQLADSLSAEMVAQAKGIQIVDRGLLWGYLVREHIPSNLLKDRKAARWFASQLQASAVLIGSVEQRGDHFDLLVELLNVSNEKIGSEEAIDISILDPQSSLAPFEPYDEERAKATHTRDYVVPTVGAGAKGTSVPACVYCPPPRYTDAARSAKFNGTVALEVTVTEEGQAADISVLKGAPFGLNGAAMEAVSSWKFTPASDGEKAVAVRVPIEMTFRLY